jgi:DNA-binding NarL/FixJ family response regulator
VGEAKDGVEARGLVAGLGPDVLVLDLVMPGPKSLDVEHWGRRHYPEIATLILTAHDRDAFLAEMEEAGAEGFLTKGYTCAVRQPRVARDPPRSAG